MKNCIYLIAILFVALFTFGCGSNEKPETTTGNETKPILTAGNSNAVVSPQTVNTTNVRDSNQSVNGKVRSGEKKDADDLLSGNTNQKRLDRDDQNKPRDADDKPSRIMPRRDSDDNRERDNDSDSDDN